MEERPMKRLSCCLVLLALALLLVSPAPARAGGPGQTITGTIVAGGPTSVTVVCQQTLWPPFTLVPGLTSVRCNGTPCYAVQLPVGATCTINFSRQGYALVATSVAAFR